MTGLWLRYRIVQRAIESCETAMARLEDILQSPWPIFQVLHLMSLMRQSDHDSLLDPEHLEALKGLKARLSSFDFSGFPSVLRGLGVKKSTLRARLHPFPSPGRRPHSSPAALLPYGRVARWSS